jgi:hypothetical protein
LCADAGPDLAATRREAEYALGTVPGAVAWVNRLGMRDRIDANTFAKRCAPTMVRCAVQGVVASASPDCDLRLGALLEAGIAACPAPDTEIAAPAVAGARLPSRTGGSRAPSPCTLAPGPGSR